MMQYACEDRVNMVVIFEPYRQMPCWFNDEGGDASIWVTLFNGRHAVSETLISKSGIVGIRVETVYCACGYCSPDMNRHDFDAYVRELEEVLKNGRKGAPALIVAWDFNAKSLAWGSKKTEPRGTYLRGVVTKNELIPKKTMGNYSFMRNGRTNFLDILSVNRRMRLSWRKSTMLDWYSASDHYYLLHVFVNNVKRVVGGILNMRRKILTWIDI